MRQTISKWEKGLSVPDANLLIHIADIFEVSVSELLGSRIENEEELNVVAEQLARINEQLAIKNRRARRIWKIITIILVVIVLLYILAIVLFMFNPNSVTVETSGASSGEVVFVDELRYKHYPL